MVDMEKLETEPVSGRTVTSPAAASDTEEPGRRLKVRKKETRNQMWESALDTQPDCTAHDLQQRMGCPPSGSYTPAPQVAHIVAGCR